MDTPPSSPSRKAAERKFKTFDEDDIVRHAMVEDIPVVGLVRDRGEYKEMREMSLIFGATRGMTPQKQATTATATAAAAATTDESASA